MSGKFTEFSQNIHLSIDFGGIILYIVISAIYGVLMQVIIPYTGLNM
jgi:hypothetical protein